MSTEPSTQLTLRRSKNLRQMDVTLLWPEAIDAVDATQKMERFASLKSMTLIRNKKPFYGTIDSLSMIDVACEALSWGWDVQLPSGPLRAAQGFEIKVVSLGTSGFLLGAQFRFDGAVLNLNDLTTALKSGERLVPLGDGRMGALPSEWSSKFSPLLEIGTLTPKGLHLSRLQALMIHAAFDSGTSVRGDAGYLAFRKMLADFQNPPPAEPGEHFHGTLRPYQKEGLAWLSTLARHKVGGILADDMGLGKTVQILSLLSHQVPVVVPGKPMKRTPPSLIVAPKSLIFNWAAEAAKFTPDLEVLILAGEKSLSSIADADLVLTTYQTLRNQIEKLKDFRFDTLVMDEAHTVKNRTAQVSVAARQIQADKKIALTGTPVENSISDLFSILSTVSPELITPQQAQHWEQANDPQFVSALGRALRPFILRRTKAQVLTDLPEKSEQIIYCELSSEERKCYMALKAKYWTSLKSKIREKGVAGSKIEILEGLLRLRQAACHISLVSGILGDGKQSASSSKFTLVIDQLETILAEGSRALIFSQFTSLLELFGNELKSRGVPFEYLDGQTKDRAERVIRFQTGQGAKVFLLSLKAGGVGLNLTAADYVFILDPWWNPAAEAQAIDRAHRMGQTKRVFAYKIIAKDTVEEKILEMQNAKRRLANSVIAGDASPGLQSLTLRDLETLFA